MVYCFSTENYEVWEGPPVGKVLKVFVFHRTLRNKLNKDDVLKIEFNNKLQAVISKIEARLTTGFILSEDPKKIVVTTKLPQEVQAVFDRKAGR